MRIALVLFAACAACSPPVTGSDAADASIDAVSQDVATDTGVDAVRDASSRVISFDLAGVYDSEQFVAVFTGTHATGCAGTACDDVRFGTSGALTSAHCVARSGVSDCTAQQCGGITGAICDGIGITGAGPSGVAGVSLSDLTSPERPIVVSMAEHGPMYADSLGHARMNFHITARLAPTASADGMSGIAGITTTPTDGDLWLVGAPLN